MRTIVERDADREQDHAVLADRDVGKHFDDAFDRQELRDDPGRFPVALVRPREENREDPEGRNEPGDPRCTAQRPHHEQVDRAADQRGEPECEHPRDRGRRPRLTLVVEDERADHADRTVREVDDTRAAVDEHDPERRHRIHGSGSEAEDRKPQDVVRHRLCRRPEAR